MGDFVDAASTIIILIVYSALGRRANKQERDPSGCGARLNRAARSFGRSNRASLRLFQMWISERKRTEVL